MEDARALLDSLMGPSRDKSREENLKGDGWKAPNVCKRYLVGFCPNSAQDNWFHNTRRKDINVCTKIHSDRLKADFEKHPDREKYEPDYEKDFLDFLEGLVREADAWIARENANCQPAGKVTKMPPSVKEKVAQLKAQSDLLFKQAEDASDNNNIAASKTAVDLAEMVKKEIEELKEKHTFVSQGEKVCDVCGVRCNPDEKADYQAHLMGRLHEGYTNIRAKVKELREKVRGRREQPREKEGTRERGERDKEGTRERGERDKDAEKARDRDKEGTRERGERDKDAEKTRDRDKDREAEKNRGDRDRDKRRNADGDRGERDRRRRDTDGVDRRDPRDRDRSRERERSRDRERRRDR